MKVPKAKKMSSGNYFIRLRLGGEEICITEPTEKECIRQAQFIKSEYMAGKREKKEKVEHITLEQACERFIEKRRNMLSPSTIRGYKYIIKHRFPDLMQRDVYSITESEWIIACNKQSAITAPKTTQNAWGFVSSVLRNELNITPPNVALPQVPPNNRPFLDDDQIKIFVEAVKGDPIEIPALLALSGLRRSEICALRWENIDLKNRLIHIKGAAVYNEDNILVQKKANKNKKSTRTVPIMMDALHSALSESQKPSGLVVTRYPDNIRIRINKICEKKNITLVGTHGMRHSFASLAKHVGMPEQVTMEIGGWSDYQTMRKIYTHISQNDADRYKNEMANFFNSASKKATEPHKD